MFPFSSGGPDDPTEFCRRRFDCAIGERRPGAGTAVSPPSRLCVRTAVSDQLQPQLRPRSGPRHLRLLRRTFEQFLLARCCDLPCTGWAFPLLLSASIGNEGGALVVRTSRGQGGAACKPE